MMTEPIISLIPHRSSQIIDMHLISQKFIFGAHKKTAIIIEPHERRVGHAPWYIFAISPLIVLNIIKCDTRAFGMRRA